MAHRSAGPTHLHGPENAEHEIRKAYNCVIDTGVGHFWDRKPIPGVNPDEVITIYKRSLENYNRGNRLAAERWARSAKHLGRACWHEAKIAFLEPRAHELAYLEGATAEELGLHETIDSTSDLLDSAAHHLSAVPEEVSERMNLYLNRARKHLSISTTSEYKHELRRAERIKVAHEYARVLECMALAFEAEGSAESAA